MVRERPWGHGGARTRSRRKGSGLRFRALRLLVAACVVVAFAALAAPASGAEPAACDVSNPPPATMTNPAQLCLTVASASDDSSSVQPVTFTASANGKLCGDCPYGPLQNPVDATVDYTFTATNMNGTIVGSQGPGPVNTFSLANQPSGQWDLAVTVILSSSNPSNFASSTVTNDYKPPLIGALVGPEVLGTQYAGPGASDPHFGGDTSNVAQTIDFIAGIEGGTPGFSYTLNGQAATSEPCPSFLGSPGPNTFCGNFTPGHYQLQVTVTDVSGATDTATVSFSVTDPRYRVTLGATQSQPVVGETVTYTANATLPAVNTTDTSATIPCGDCTYTLTSTDPNGNPGPSKGPSSDPTLTLTPSLVGSWTVAVTVSEPTEGTTSTSEQVQVHPILTGAITGPSVTTAGVNVVFDASGVGGYSGGPGYSYSFSVDGAPLTSSTNPAASTTFSVAGNHTVSVTIADAANPAHTTTRSLTVAVAPALGPSFSVSPTGAVAAGSAVSFAGAVTGGDGPYAYTWDFGDGGSATGQSVSHTFGGGGTFNVSLTVTDGNGAVATTSQTVTVTGQRSSSCLGTVAFELTQATTSGCLVKQADGTYTTTDGAKVNGLPFPPTNAAHPLVLTPPDSGHPGGQISVSTVSISLDGFDAYDGSVSWDLPAGGKGDLKQVATLAVPNSALIKGLPVQGSISLEFGEDTSGNYYSVLPLHVSLPSIFKAGPTSAAPSAEGDASIRVDDQGVHYDGLKIQVQNVWIGDLQVDSVCFSYVPGGSSGAVSPCAIPSLGGTPYLSCGTNPAVDRWDGNAVLTLPTPSQAQLALFGGVSGGSLANLGVFADNLGTSVPIVPGVYLTRVGLGLCVNPPPLQIRGDVGVSLLPAAGSSALSVNGTALFVDGNPWSLTLSGTVDLGGQVELGSGSLTLEPENNLAEFSLSSGFSLAGGLVSVSGSLSGWLQTSPAGFNLDGNASACISSQCGSAQATISSVGLAGCVDLGSITVYYPDGFRTPTLDNLDPVVWGSYTQELQGGFGYYWGDSSPSLFAGWCDLGDYAAAQAAAASTGFVVHRGTHALAVRIAGRGGAPVVRLTGPRGIVITPPQGDSERLAHHGMYVENRLAGSTNVLLVDPRPGRWHVSAVPGSVPVSAIQTAASLPPAFARGAVGHLRGGRLLLGYVYDLPPGARMKLFAVGVDRSVQPLGSASGHPCPQAPHRPRGAMCGFREFFPLGGPAGRRTVYGVVYRHGMAQRRITIARFSLPRISIQPPTPAVHVVRTRGGISVTFTRVRGASHYALAVQLSDGRVISRTITRGHDVFIARVGAKVSAKVMVWAMTSRGVVGRPGKAYAAARPHRRAPRRRR